MVIECDALEDWQLGSSKPDWAEGLREAWTPGEPAARERLASFLDGIKGYSENRDRPDKPATSRLVATSALRRNQCGRHFHAARFAADRGGSSRDIEKFLSELGWREFSYHLLHHYPDLATKNLQQRFDDFPWRSDAASMEAWQRGQTGYPFVDAGMRELWHTGWMHNRVRMVVASFLIKHLLIDWRRGEQWFWDTLVDADPANNTASWQWVAGSGADAAPYFRIFNPVLQGETFDPDGSYVRQWIPKLQTCPTSSSTSRGSRQRQYWPTPGSSSEKPIRSQSSITTWRAGAPSPPSIRSRTDAHAFAVIDDEDGGRTQHNATDR